MTTTSPAIASDPPLHPALVTPRRPAPPSAVSASLSFGWRALLKIRRVPVQLFDILVHPVVFTLMFTYLFGGALGGSAGRYLGYLVPGILVMTLLVTTGSTGSALSTDIAKGIFDRFRTLPIWSAAPLAGALLANLVRYALASTVVIALGEALGFRPPRRPARDPGRGAARPGILLQPGMGVDSARTGHEGIWRSPRHHPGRAVPPGVL